MKKTTLLIMAAGLGSRYGCGIKQLEPVGFHDEIIMDYSIHDAIKAGFNKIVFVIRKEIEVDFHERIGNRVQEICARHGVECTYAYQELSDIPGVVPEGRTKPWGTGQAVLAARSLIREPFAVINADDYYGKEAFQQMHDWLVLGHEKSTIAMIGFMLKNTLSDNGGVTRGICQLEESHTHISGIHETYNIIKTVDGNGTIGAQAYGVVLNPNAYVSMNFWGFPAETGCLPYYMECLEHGFQQFFREDVKENPLTAEYLLPNQIGTMLQNGTCSVKLLETKDSWFGITCVEDKELVVRKIHELVENGVYCDDLYADL